MKTDTQARILDYIKVSGPLGPTQIAQQLQISTQMVHRHLKALISIGEIKKMGVPPRVLYMTSKSKQAFEFPDLDKGTGEYINTHYLNISPEGEILEGVAGFQWWAYKTKQQAQYLKLAKEYTENHKSYTNKYRNELGVIQATFKIKDTFDSCYLDHLFYQEFYSLPKFGKTKSGQLVYLGKSGQDIHAIQTLAELSRKSIERIINYYHIDGVIYAPHSIPRKIAFLKELKRFLALKVPHSELDKIFAGKTPVAQKSLSKLSDRIENAQNTIYTREENKVFKRVLVIDDAVGSGATLNTIAKKLKRQAKVEFVCGFSVTGSLKGFEVVNEI